MSPYRRPALRYIAPEPLKTSLKRKIKFAWNYANNDINSLFGFVYLPIAIVCLPFERKMIFPIGLIIVVMLATMLWSWFSFFIQAKRRNKHAKQMDELRKHSSLFLPFWNDWICNSCKRIFQTEEKAMSHAVKCAEMFQCNSCGGIFETQEQIELHNETCS